MTSASIPHCSIRFSRPPTAVIPSTIRSASWAFTTLEMSAIGFVRPVEVSFQQRVTARKSFASRAAATFSGSAAEPHSKDRDVAAAKVLQRSWNRSLNFPFTRFRTRSSLRSSPVTAASNPAVPDPLSTATSRRVPKRYCVSVRTSDRTSLNSGPRWFIAGLAIACRTRGSIFTGPGRRNTSGGVAGILSPIAVRAINDAFRILITRQGGEGTAIDEGRCTRSEAVSFVKVPVMIKYDATVGRTPVGQTMPK